MHLTVNQASQGYGGSNPSCGTMIDYFRQQERDGLEGRRRACYHAFEMIYWHREAQKELRQAFQNINIPDPDGAAYDDLQHAGAKLLHHAYLLGDELSLLEEPWPEEPIDQGSWYKKFRRLMAHVTAGDDCPVGQVCEALGGIVMVGKMAATRQGEVPLTEAIQHET